MNKFKDFLLKSENFQNKSFLFISFEGNKLKEKILLENDYEFIIESIYKFFKDHSINKFEEKPYFNNYKKVNIRYDFIFINTKNHILKKEEINNILEEKFDLMKSGSRIFISQPNYQNIKNYLTQKFKQKKENFHIQKKLLMYDYIYYGNIFYIKIKKYIPKNRYISKISFVIKKLIYIRFFFLAPNILVKYAYVPEIRN